MGAKKLAEKEEIDIRLYSITTMPLMKSGCHGGHAVAEIKEEITGTAEVLNVFKITRWNVAGCIVREGKLAVATR
jgi:translation initiation factor IF-2